MNDQQRGSNAGNKRSASLGAVGALASQVKTRLAQDQSWQHFALNGAWICPYCLAGVRGHDDSRAALVRAIESHLARRCSVYRGGSGACHPDETIAAKKTFEDIAHRAASDAAWQVFDHEGFWYSPTSLQRVESVRLTNGRFDSFTIQAMVNHLGHCTAFQRGVVYPAATVQKARDQGMRAVSLAENLRELLQFPLWRYTNAAGQWVCPFCLEHIPDVVLRGDADWTTAPQKMAWHLACSCATYVPERPEPKMEALVQQAAARTSATATPLSSGAIPRIGSGSSRTLGTPGTVRTTTPLSGGTRRPNTPSGSAPTVAPPIVGPRMATPLPGSILKGPQSPAIPPVNGTGTGRSSAPPRVARPVTARHVAPPTAPVAPAPPSAGDRDADDFFAGMPLDGMVTDAPALPGKADEGAASNDNGQSLSWMDEVEDHRHQDRHQDTERVRARDVQKGLLQEAPAVPGFTFATRFEACHDVSGDFYEFIKLSDGRIGFAQGDVSGHGMTAGLIMSMAKKTLAIYAGLGGNPTEVLSRTNDALVDDLGGKTFVSMCYAILDPEHRTITWARAGHSPTIRYNVKSGALEEIKPKGMVVGMKKGPMFRACLEEQVTRIESGDVFLVYTDGITECMNRQQAEYGLDQLFEVVRKHAATGADHLLERIMQSVRQFRGGTVASDDATLLALVAE